MRRLPFRRAAVALLIALIVAPVLAIGSGTSASAAPLQVSVPGDFNSEIGCGGDFDPTCAQAQLVSGFGGNSWTLTVSIPAGTWSYNIYIDGAYGPPSGQRTFTLAATTNVTFFYSATADRFSSTAEDPLVTAIGDFQSDLGCPGDFAADCPISWLFSDGTGKYSFATTGIPAGTYAALAAHDLGLTETYGVGGALGGANIPFTAVAGQTIVFSYDLASHVLTISPESTAITASSATVAPGGTVSGTGQGFSPGESVDLAVGAGAAGTVVADALGRISYTVTVPSGSPAGPLVVTATGASSSRSATQTVTVTAVAGAGSGSTLAATGVDVLAGELSAVLLVLVGIGVFGAAAIRSRRV